MTSNNVVTSPLVNKRNTTTMAASATARHKYSLVDTQDDAEKGEQKETLAPSQVDWLRKVRPAKRSVGSERCLALSIVTMLVCTLLIMTSQNEGVVEQRPVVGQVDGWSPNIAPGPIVSSLEFDAALRHGYPFLSKTQNLKLADSVLSNEELFKSFGDESGRFLLHVLLDKPVYRPGEVVRGAAFLMNAFTQNPPKTTKMGMNVRIKDAKEVEIATFYVSDSSDSVGAIQWAIPKEIAGGDFKMIVEANAYPSTVLTSERTFEVRATRASNAKISKKLEFAKEGYSAGEVVDVVLNVDQSPDSTTVQFSSTVDGQVLSTTEFEPVVNGQAKYSITLPSKLGKGDGVVTAKVKRSAYLESVSKTIPIVTQAVDIGLFPEGGVLVSGLLQRVYVEVLDVVSQKPIDFSAEIYSNLDEAKPLASMQSLHEGRGASPYFVVPKEAKDIFFKLTSPSGIAGQKKSFPLRVSQVADVKEQATFTVGSAVFQTSLELTVHSTAPGRFSIGLFRREKRLDTLKLQTTKESSNKAGRFQSEPTFLSLGDNDEHYGVIRLTLFNENDVPVAERLVFRLPKTVLDVEISASVIDDVSDKDAELDLKNKRLQASPSDGIAVQVKTWARKLDPATGLLTGPKEPVAAVVALRVTDSAMPATVEDRLLPPRLPEAVWLESEVDRVNDAGQYLPGSSWAWREASPEANRKKGTFSQRLDLLLGTQGWRMFAYYDAAGFARTGLAPLIEGSLVPAGCSQDGKTQQKKAPVNRVALERMFAGREPPKYQVMASQAQRAFFGGGNVKKQRARPMMMNDAAVFEENMEEKLVDRLAYDEGADEENDEEDDAVEVADLVAAAPEPPVAPEMEAPMDAGGQNAPMMGDDLGDERDDHMGGLAMGQKIAPQQAARAFLLRPAAYPVFQRIYAHPQRKYVKKEFEQGAKRSDFTETVYFNPSLKTECSGNQKECSVKAFFGLSESSTALFVAHADGYAIAKPIVLGTGSMSISTAAPLEIDFNLPSLIIDGDRPVIPITVINRLGKDVVIKSASTPVNLVKTKSKEMKLSAAQDARIYAQLEMSPYLQRGERFFNLTFAAQSGDFKDAVTRGSVIAPKGFPASQFFGGTFKRDPTTIPFKLPDDYVSGSLRVIARGYTSPLGRLNKALEELIREPCGCFEQTSSTTYPLVFVLQYLKSHTGSDPAMIKKAQDMLQKGYARLVSYESPGGGFEWFGAAPGHEALTAYGLLQFAAMAHPSVGINVDKVMVERTKKWMDSRRDGKGGFFRNERSLDSFGGAPTLTTNAYITWALVRAGLLRAPKRDREIETLIAKATNENDPASKDPYVIALAALSLFDANAPSAEDIALAKTLARKLATMQEETEGSVRDAASTITQSRGEALEIETTALSVLVWIHEPEAFAMNARKAVDFVAARCKNGRFASTQATALSLMAIVEFDRIYSKPLPYGAVELSIGDKIVQVLRFGPKEDKPAPSSTQSKPSLDAVAALLGNSNDECKGGSEWNECGTACPLMCGSPEPQICTLQCVARCQCPSDAPIMSSDGQCVAKCEGSASETDADAEGILTFDSEKILRALGDSPKASKDFSLKVTLADAESKASPSIPYSIAFKYSVVKPSRDPKFTHPRPLDLTVTLAKQSEAAIVEGDVVTIEATIKNISKNKQGEAEMVPMVVAIIGIPGGCEARTDQLRELKNSKVVDFVESRPGEVILYWRALKPGYEATIPIQVTASIPGLYKSPASRAYLYYTDEDKVWADGFSLKIQSQEGAKLFW